MLVLNHDGKLNRTVKMGMFPGLIRINSLPAWTEGLKHSLMPVQLPETWET